MAMMAMMIMAMAMMVMMMMMIIMLTMMVMTTSDDMSRCGNESYSGVREVENGDPEESRRMIDSRIGALHSEVTQDCNFLGEIRFKLTQGIVFKWAPVSDCHVIIDSTHCTMAQARNYI